MAESFFRNSISTFNKTRITITGVPFDVSPGIESITIDDGSTLEAVHGMGSALPLAHNETKREPNGSLEIKLGHLKDILTLFNVANVVEIPEIDISKIDNYDNIAIASQTVLYRVKFEKTSSSTQISNVNELITLPFKFISKSLPLKYV